MFLLVGSTTMVLSKRLQYVTSAAMVSKEAKVTQVA